MGVEDGWWEAGGEDVDFKYSRTDVCIREDGDELVILSCSGR